MVDRNERHWYNGTYALQCLYFILENFAERHQTSFIIIFFYLFKFYDRQIFFNVEILIQSKLKQ